MKLVTVVVKLHTHTRSSNLSLVTTHILMFTRPHTRRRSLERNFLFKVERKNEAQDSSRGRSGPISLSSLSLALAAVVLQSIKYVWTRVCEW